MPELRAVQLEFFCSPAAGYWRVSQRADPRAYLLYRRHYSATIKHNDRYRRPGNFNFVGPGFNLVLLTPAADALFVWVKNNAPRFDGQRGVCCTIFRNETSGPHVLSSDLIREADTLAAERWPGERHFTYVDIVQTARRRSRHAQPGHCFVAAGWQPCGVSKRGLLLLERVG
jgi:hypothetical protein